MAQHGFDVPVIRQMLQAISQLIALQGGITSWKK
jgi:hypothetical protein